MKHVCKYLKLLFHIKKKKNVIEIEGKCLFKNFSEFLIIAASYLEQKIGKRLFHLFLSKIWLPSSFIQTRRTFTAFLSGKY